LFLGLLTGVTRQENLDPNDAMGGSGSSQWQGGVGGMTHTQTQSGWGGSRGMTSTNTFRKGGPPSILNSVTSRFGGVGADDVPAQRPMTSVKAAGYSSTGQGSRPVFDPLMQGARGPAPALQKKTENNPEDMARLMENKVNELLEASAFANAAADYVLALDKAKEAGKKERQLWKHREGANLMDSVNIDLTYSVCFNLAVQYHANKQYSEALNTCVPSLPPAAARSCARRIARRFPSEWLRTHSLRLLPTLAGTR
jgi:hypothetical protein